MIPSRRTPIEEHLIVFHEKSKLVYETGDSQTFEEGKLSKQAQARLQIIRTQLRDGFLQTLIDDCHRPNVILDALHPQHLGLLTRLVESVTSEVGRAVVGLTILQLCIKTIAPTQSIRLHKGGNSYSRTRFSWKEGIPMRSLDRNFITPVLRANDLLRINRDGFMMTRSLAENYPYSRLYKAAIRGAREEWIAIVDLLETGELNAESALRQMITLLLNKSASFDAIANMTLDSVGKLIANAPSADQIIPFIATYIDQANYSARLLEVAMHSLFQTLEDWALLEGELKALSQMRSANKKHGNVADIEVTLHGSSFEIIEAWDAKYGKPYLRDELEELNEKLRDHSETLVAGFVVDKEPQLVPEITERRDEIAAIHNVEIYLLSFETWARQQLTQAGDQIDALARDWLLAFVETLCQKRRQRAPIDEPADLWVRQLNQQLMTGLS